VAPAEGGPSCRGPRDGGVVSVALIHGYVKDLDLRLPLLGPIRFKDLDGNAVDGWLIAAKELTLKQRAVIYKDCQARIDMLPLVQFVPPEAEFWKEVLAHGMPIRADRVDVAYDLRGFV